MNDVDKLNKLIFEFNTLIARKIKADEWLDDPKTTDADRERWKPKLFDLYKNISSKADELKAVGFEIHDWFIWWGIRDYTEDEQLEIERFKKRGEVICTSVTKTLK